MTISNDKIVYALRCGTRAGGKVWRRTITQTLLQHKMCDGTGTVLGRNVGSSVADTDPYVFEPPGSWFISQRYRSETKSVYHQAKKVRKTLILSVL